MRIIDDDMTMEEVVAALMSLDTDQDGRLCVDEFLDLVGSTSLRS